MSFDLEAAREVAAECENNGYADRDTKDITDQNLILYGILRALIATCANGEEVLDELKSRRTSH